MQNEGLLLVKLSGTYSYRRALKGSETEAVLDACKENGIEVNTDKIKYIVFSLKYGRYIMPILKLSSLKFNLFVKPFE